MSMQRQTPNPNAVKVDRKNVKNKAFAKDDVKGMNKILDSHLALNVIESEKMVVLVYEDKKGPMRVVLPESKTIN